MRDARIRLHCDDGSAPNTYQSSLLSIEKLEMCRHTGIDMKRLNNWFVNNRIRIWKPKFEAMQKQQKEQPQQHQVQQTTPRTLLVIPQSEVTQATSEEGCLEATKALAGKVAPMNSVTPPSHVNVPRRVSLPLPTAASRLVHQVSDVSLNNSDASSTVSSSVSIESGSTSEPLKRPAVEVSSVCFETPPRTHKRARLVSDAASPRYVEKDVEQWKQVCLSSPRLDDKSLPSLDEAACLFGYSSVVV
jgi:hypothetical protein